MRHLIWDSGTVMDLCGEDFFVTGRYLPGMGFLWSVSHKSLPVALKIKDYVDPYVPLWSRSIWVSPREPGGCDTGPTRKLVSVQSFALGENTIGEEGVWDPRTQRLYHFKRWTWVAIEVRTPELLGLQAAVAKMRDGGVKIDCSSGRLEGPTVDHGFIQSAVAVDVGRVVEMRLAFGSVREEADGYLNALSFGKSVEIRSRRYWRCLTPQATRRETVVAPSLKVLVSHCDRGGGVIASCDGGILGDYRDHYRYVWPRDAAMCVMALAKSGFPEFARDFLVFCAKAISPEGLFWQRYRPDGSRGSGWHPWDVLPIQEDELGLSLAAAGSYLEITGDLGSLERAYESFVRPAAQFILDYRTKGGALVQPSYDLWEERRGILSFTQAACARGLMEAYRIAFQLGLQRDALVFKEGSLALTRGLISMLSNDHLGFCRLLKPGSMQADFSEDSSLYLIPLLLPVRADSSALFGSFWPKTLVEALGERSVLTWKRIAPSLSVFLRGVPAPLMARYPGDWYQRPPGAGNLPGNPWLVTTAWYALSGFELGLLGKAELEIYLKWFMEVGSESGVLPEQVSCVTGEPLSVSPLAWSHAMHLELYRVIRALERGKDKDEDWR